MEQAGAIELVVLDPDGNPVVGAEVSSWPSQAYSHDSGTTILGFCYKSIELVNSRIAGRSAPIANLSKADRYNSLTDEDGKAFLHDIPLNRPLEFSTYHKDYVVRDKPKLPFRGTKYQCNSPEPKKITVHMAQPEKAKANTKVAPTAESNKE